LTDNPFTSSTSSAPHFASTWVLFRGGGFWQETRTPVAGPQLSASLSFVFQPTELNSVAKQTLIYRPVPSCALALSTCGQQAWTHNLTVLPYTNTFDSFLLSV
jgi:hypothetical protein